MIRHITGNLSVDYMRKSIGGGPLPEPGSHAAELDEFQELGFDGVEDYLAWGVCERDEGRFDFEFHRVNQEQCARRGLAYVVYPWVHVVPHWFRAGERWTPFRCLEHDAEVAWPSIFDPRTLDIYRRFYGAVNDALGNGIDSVCLAVPVDYGEVGYPTGWGAWVSQPQHPRDHVHAGFWAGDVHARAAYRRAMLHAFGDLEGLNRAFGTAHETEEQIRFPELTAPPASILATARFYLQAMVSFVDQMLGVVREIFPDKPLYLKVGHGGEMLAYGIEPTQLVRVAAQHGARIRTTQATLPEIHQKRLSTACRFFQVPFASEPPVDIGREKFVERIFTDASNGSIEYFDYPEHVLGSRDLLEMYGPLMTGELPLVDVGLFFPSTDQHSRPLQGLPPVLMDLGDPIRDRFDYELIDEPLIEAGALAGLHVLGMPEGRYVPDAIQERLLQWIRAGGHLVVGPEVNPTTLEGPLGALLREAPDASSCVDLVGTSAESTLARLGTPGDSLWLGGEWYYRESAHQFRGTPPEGEFSRWSAARSSAFFPIRAGRSYLLEIACWLHPASVQMRHHVLVAGELVGRITRPGLQRFAAWVHQDLLVGLGVAEVSLESEPFRLVDLGAGDDTRELGVAVIWMRMTEEGSPAAGVDGGGRPQLTGRIRRAAFESQAALPLEKGTVVVSRRRPSLHFLTLLEESVRRHSVVRRAALQGSFEPSDPPGIRCTVFPSKLLLWNRGPEEREIELRATEHAPERILIPGGGTLGVDRITGRLLP